MRRLLYLVPLLAVLGCGGDGTTEPTADPTFAGEWRGTARDGLAVIVLDVTVQGSTVAGEALHQWREDDPIAYSVSGSQDHPDVTFVASYNGNELFTFTGSFTGPNTVSGTLDGAGYRAENDSITFRRQ